MPKQLWRSNMLPWTYMAVASNSLSLSLALWLSSCIADLLVLGNRELQFIIIIVCVQNLPLLRRTKTGCIRHDRVSR